MAGLEANLGVIRGKIEGGVTGTIGVDFIDNGSELTYVYVHTYVIALFL